MKVIFLDIDGVLNCKKTHNPRKFPYVVDQTLLKRFKSLIERTGAKVVLSSTWRVDPVGVMAAERAGVPFIDTCPDMPGEARCKEIQTWLAEHPDVSRFVVIDDENDGLDGLPLFQPSFATGITDEIVDGVADYLNGKTDKTIHAGALVRAFQNIRCMFNRDMS
jgi:hypothetical protein